MVCILHIKHLYNVYDIPHIFLEMQQNKTLGELTLFSEVGGGDLTIIFMFDAEINRTLYF